MKILQNGNFLYIKIDKLHTKLATEKMNMNSSVYGDMI